MECEEERKQEQQKKPRMLLPRLHDGNGLRIGDPSEDEAEPNNETRETGDGE